MNFDFGVVYPRVRITFRHMAITLELNSGFLDETNFLRMLGPVPTGPFYNPNTVPILGKQYAQLALGPVNELWLRGRLPAGQNYV